MKTFFSVLFGFTLQATIALAANHVVIMKSISYDPPQLSVKVGDTVTWDNQSYTEHSANSESTPPAFETGRVKPKAHSSKVTFDKAGTYKYHCSVHGKTMSGEIVVAP